MYDQAWQQDYQKIVFSPNAHSKANNSVCLALRRQVSQAGRKSEVAFSSVFINIFHMLFWGDLCAVRSWHSSAVYGILQQFMAFYSSLWYSIAVYGILQQFMAFYSSLWHSTAFYGTLQQFMVFYSSLWHSTAVYGILQQFMVFYSILWHSTAVYGIL
jgi:hypothetical protein